MLIVAKFLKLNGLIRNFSHTFRFWGSYCETKIIAIVAIVIPRDLDGPAGTWVSFCVSVALEFTEIWVSHSFI